MGDTASSPLIAGYLSIVAGVLGAIVFLLQFVGPMVAMLAFMPAMTMVSFRSYDVDNGALYQGFECWEPISSLAVSEERSSATR